MIASTSVNDSVLELSGLSFPIKSDQRGSAWVNITPEDAEKLLNLRKEGKQRKVSLSRLNKYKNEMLEGRWVDGSLDPIAISTEGNLSNGQHRLTAIKESGKSFLMNLTWGVPQEVIDKLDQQGTRSIRDVAAFQGKSFSESETAAVKFFLPKTPDYNIIRVADTSKDVFIQYLDRYELGIRWASQHITASDLRLGYTIAAFAKAYYVFDLKDVEDFAQMYSTGLPVDRETPVSFVTAVTLRNDLLMRWKKTSVPPDVRHKMTCNAVWQGILGTDLKSIKTKTTCPLHKALLATES